MMTDARVMSIDELKAFLASSDVFTFKGNSREEIYAWIERTLRGYRSRPRLEKGLLRRYMRKITGISNSQLTRRSLKKVLRAEARYLLFLFYVVVKHYTGLG